MSKSTFKLLNRPMIMGILNVTPDSFSDGGRFQTIDNALYQAEKMLREGADILDIGGESTRPGAAKVSVSQELDRVIPVIEKLKSNFDCRISLDTSKAEVMLEGVKANIDIINDVCALTQPGAIEAAAECDLPICLMHMQGTPRSMQVKPNYHDLVQDIKQFFVERVQQCKAKGIEKSRLILDPGFGFGKSVAHNFKLLNEFDQFAEFGLPLLAGLSRKSMLGKLLDLDTDKRINASVVSATLAMTKGARIIRVHDVAETKQAVTLFDAVTNGVISE